MVIPATSSKPTEGPEMETETETETTTVRKHSLKHFPTYGSMNGNPTGDTCPTCRGTGRIPRGDKDRLVAVIPCNDVRLKPRRTKLYVFISMAVCLFVCCLILFFLFPRSVTLSPVSVQRVMVYFRPDTVELNIVNLINITNENFVPVQIVKFSGQGLVNKAVVGKITPMNMSTSIPARSQISHNIQIDLVITDEGISNYCKSSIIKIHSVFLELQMTLNISYLSHTEQLSLDTFEYIDCGSNSTIPHPMG